MASKVINYGLPHTRYTLLVLGRLRMWSLASVMYTIWTWPASVVEKITLVLVIYIFIYINSCVSKLFFLCVLRTSKSSVRIKLDCKGTVETHSHNGLIVGPLHHHGYRLLGFLLQAILRGNLQNLLNVPPRTILNGGLIFTTICLTFKLNLFYCDFPSLLVSIFQTDVSRIVWLDHTFSLKNLYSNLFRFSLCSLSATSMFSLIYKIKRSWSLVALTSWQ